MSDLRSEAVAVNVEHLSDRGLSVARFEWPDYDNPQTYTIAINRYVSLELDQHSPVRPNAVRVYDDGAELSAEVLSTLVGRELTEAMLAAQKVGFTALTVSLSPDNRFAIAGLQAASPSTPPVLRKGCETMVAEHERVLRARAATLRAVYNQAS